MEVERRDREQTRKPSGNLTDQPSIHPFASLLKSKRPIRRRGAQLEDRGDDTAARNARETKPLERNGEQGIDSAGRVPKRGRGIGGETGSEQRGCNDSGVNRISESFNRG